jgi:hypothetical protein
MIINKKLERKRNLHRNNLRLLYDGGEARRAFPSFRFYFDVFLSLTHSLLLAFTSRFFGYTFCVFQFLRSLHDVAAVEQQKLLIYVI